MSCPFIDMNTFLLEDVVAMRVEERENTRRHCILYFITFLQELFKQSMLICHFNGPFQDQYPPYKINKDKTQSIMCLQHFHCYKMSYVALNNSLLQTYAPNDELN